MRPPASLIDEPLGLRPDRQGGFRACIWAPGASRVRIVPAAPGADEVSADAAARFGAGEAVRGLHGLWTADLPGVEHGDRYRIELDGVTHRDPWSRWQPDGCDGPPAALDPRAIGATAVGRGARPPRPELDPEATILYELHVGAFTRGGGLVDVIPALDRLVALGVTHIELMPVAQFPGRHGWGYDGIFWSAVQHSYGGPAAFVALVDAAHERGLGVIADVVYNHVGPTGGEVYEAFGPFFTDRHQTAWGPAVNVDGPGSDAVRETVFQAAEWFVDDLGVDGLRVDACHAIVDQSARHVLAELTDRVRGVHPGAVLIAESGRNDPATVRAEDAGGWGFDGDWADDFHHSLRAVLTGDRRAWLGDFGSVEHLARAFTEPYLHDGRWSEYRQRRFGASARAEDPHRFVVFSQNHDQVGNRPLGDRPPAPVRDLAALCTLLSPYVPMVFMGEELGEDAPFLFFTDHTNGFIADATREGRRREFAHLADDDGLEVPDPQDPRTFERSWLAEPGDAGTEDLYRRLIELRRRVVTDRPDVAFDEARRWIRLRYEAATIVMNPSDVACEVACPRGEVLDMIGGTPAWTGAPCLGTSGSSDPDEWGVLALEPWSAAVVAPR
jgi:maltooligosyltrehalose trehalohydrolase